MKTEREIRDYVEMWLAEAPRRDCAGERYSARLLTLADVLGDRDLKRKLVSWFRRARAA